MDEVRKQAVLDRLKAEGKGWVLDSQGMCPIEETLDNWIRSVPAVLQNSRTETPAYLCLSH